jgi:hypothetical protein
MDIIIKALVAVDPDRVQQYYQTLYMYDLLRERFMDVSEPTWSDVIDILRRIGQRVYFAVDEQSGMLMGEFTLEPAQGKAGLIHFSLNPEQPWPDKIKICRYCAKQILTVWKDHKGNPFVQTLVGLTPLQNRAACLTVLRVGFTKVGIIPHAAYFAGTGTTGNCMASILTKEMVDGWERAESTETSDASRVSRIARAEWASANTYCC